MKVAIFGDTHGSWDAFNATIAKAIKQNPDITHLVQVGDLGYCFPNSKPFKISQDYYETEAEFEHAISLPFYWLDGNHDNHDRLAIDCGAWQPNMVHMPRGHTLDFTLLSGEVRRAMFFGGASSIDKKYRTEYVDWWPGESITHRQVQEALAKPGPIDIVLSHERPESFDYKKVFMDGFGRSDREGLDAIRNHFKPRHYVFGHYHDWDSGEHDGTSWMCCPVIDNRSYITWDGDDIRFHRRSIERNFGHDSI